MKKNKVIELFKNWVKKLWPRVKIFWFTDWFNPHASFLSIPAFLGPLILITFVAGMTYLKVVSDQGLKFDLTGDIDQWYEWFQVPIWIFALLIPIIGLFNANHKSEQTKESLRVTGEQNRFANYYKHVEEFVKHCNHIQDHYKEFELKIIARKYHASLYLDARNGLFIPNQKLLGSSKEDMLAIIRQMRHLRQSRFQEQESLKQVFMSMMIMVAIQLNHLETFFSCKEAPLYAINLSRGSLIFEISNEDIAMINTWFFFNLILIRVTEFDPAVGNENYRMLIEVKRHFTELRVNSSLSRLEEIRSETNEKDI